MGEKTAKQWERALPRSECCQIVGMRGLPNSGNEGLPNSGNGGLPNSGNGGLPKSGNGGGGELPYCGHRCSQMRVGAAK